jgi:hypothetical protein
MGNIKVVLSQKRLSAKVCGGLRSTFSLALRQSSVAEPCPLEASRGFALSTNLVTHFKLTETFN